MHTSSTKKLDSLETIEILDVEEGSSVAPENTKKILPIPHVIMSHEPPLSKLAPCSPRQLRWDQRCRDVRSVVAAEGPGSTEGRGSRGLAVSLKRLSQVPKANLKTMVTIGPLCHWPFRSRLLIALLFLRATKA